MAKGIDRPASPRISRVIGPNRRKSPKYSVDLSAVQTLDRFTRFRRHRNGRRQVRSPSFLSAPFRVSAVVRFPVVTVTLAVLWLIGCDHGLQPPAEPATGVIHARITYEGGEESWPSPDSVRDIRFVAMRFVPRDTADFLQLNRLVFSDGLDREVDAQDIAIPEVETGLFLYSGVAQQFSPDLFDWRPVGLVTENDGVFVVSEDETTTVEVLVNFDNPPPFPPPQP